HLAGINRPKEKSEFQIGNVDFSRKLLEILYKQKQKTPIIFSSSIQASLGNPYGQSKKAAEALFKEYSKKTNAKVTVFRLQNVFGKWCKPNYNSVVATFCYNISHNLPVSISDVNTKMDLVYIDDVINAFTGEINSKDTESFLYKDVQPSYTLTLGKLAEILESFKDFRKELLAPDFSDQFMKKLYATYLSYLDPEDLSYRLEKKSDNRGYLGEFLKAVGFGQIFVSNTLPGVTRGNHYHDTKAEKFLVVDGEGVIALRDIHLSRVIEYKVKGSDLRVIDIPPGYTHSIKNTGSGNLVTLFWSSQILNSDNVDTCTMSVALDKNGGKDIQ
ncbi:MAG: NAD-dependent epimerase/dehydratase family protein, partial [Candidatus Omnitrophica bacterium]|nr:NAD-dependent epimerase/dehydratase family protein [Candidatus Omnitrophota bacterium]